MPTEDPRNAILRRRLLRGGHGRVVMPVVEEDIVALLTRGLFLEHPVDVSLLGRPGQCHFNSARLWDANNDNPDVVLWTGYAEGPDDYIWRPHSWVSNEEEGILFETTGFERDAYYGFPLTREEANTFYWENAL